MYPTIKELDEREDIVDRQLEALYKDYRCISGTLKKLEREKKLIKTMREMLEE